jgi:ABC-type dipeptide/oligopeptide/nickel transport system ATPase component
MTSALDVTSLSVHVRAGTAVRTLLQDVSFSLPRATLTALIGESGSGKSTLACALTRLFSRPERYMIAGSVFFGATDLLAIDGVALRTVRRHHVRYILQEPSESMNPLLRIETQLGEAFPSSATRKDLCVLLERVGLSDPERVLRSFPHELSIGMLQRVAIAMAIAPAPHVLIADEPTSALDQPMRLQTMDLLRSLRESLRCTALVITHDPSLIDRSADTVIVLFAGRIVEVNPRSPFGRTALHPYSRQLTGLEPAVRAPSRTVFAGGCAFASRCPRVKERCAREEPALALATDGGLVRCFYWK